MKHLLPIAALSALTLVGCGQQRDTEMWFGQVADKEYDRSSCSHSYQDCDTCTRTRSDGSTYTESCNCVTKYDHNYDYYWGIAYDWNLDGSADKMSWDGDPENDGLFAGLESKWRTFESCGDCSLSRSEQRLWDSIDRGDRVAVPHSFDNYLLVDEESLHLNVTGYVPTTPIPGYPSYYNFHQFNSAVNAGTNMDTRTWNTFLAEQNARLGHKQQVHMMVVATSDQNPQWADALEQAWVLGKKNNAIFVFGVDSEGIITWSKLVSFSGVEMMRIRVRDDFKGMHVNGQQTAEQVVSITQEHFERAPMADKEYLMRNTWWYRWRWFVLVPLGIAGGILGFLGLTGGLGAGAYSIRRRRRRW